jgi:hypothetical protein
MASPKPKASPSPQATKKSQLIVTTGRGSTIGIKDIGKVSPTPTAKPRIGVINNQTSAEYDAQLKQVLKDLAKRNK